VVEDIDVGGVEGVRFEVKDLDFIQFCGAFGFIEDGGGVVELAGGGFEEVGYRGLGPCGEREEQQQGGEPEHRHLLRKNVAYPAGDCWIIGKVKVSDFYNQIREKRAAILRLAEEHGLRRCG